ncbi:MAG: coproporphyrinogen-III oxidase family protein [Bacteriovoracaceae bacterium]
MTQLFSLYLHVPFCKHLCNYCDFYKRKLDNAPQQFEEFHQFLENSLIRHQKLLNDHGLTWGPLETVYLGGGTPSLWGKEGANFFKKHLLSQGLDNNAEFTMEVDPGTWTEEMIQSWKEIGLNRISVGTQSLDPNFLKIMDRVHSLEETVDFLKYLQKEDWNFSLDFLLGIPFSKEKKRDIKAELDLLLQHGPKHISLYILNARSKYPHIQNLPDDEYIREEYLFVSEYLKSKGFHHYEVSNFALPGFESRHNLKYWRGQSVMALGPTGTGYLALEKDRAIRYKWKVTSPEIEIENLTKKELDLEFTYLTLRTSDGWQAPKEYSCLMKSWIQQGYALEELGKIKLSSLGYLMLDSLMDDLFRLD